jgi:2-amino-4-hydroxy-6-hydroxymethyldihydropteridine diphosphokinase
MPTSDAYLALGTNLGNRQANLKIAKDRLSAGIEIVKESSIYETAPWGFTDQPQFLNQVIQVRTEFNPFILLWQLKIIERKMGRIKTFRNGPRLIDLDILFYEKRVIRKFYLQIPHPRLHERAFVLIPLAEIAPELIHPVLGLSVQELLSRINSEGVQRL